MHLTIKQLRYAKKLTMTTDKIAQPSRRKFFSSFTCRLSAFMGAAAMVCRKASSNQDKQNAVLAKAPIANNAALDKVGGFVLVKNTPAGDVLIVRTGDAQYTAMSDICPHKRCRVQVKSATLIKCPCHGSAYKIDGTYISGPSHKNLSQFHVEVADGVITVTER
jgi:Rieske Fe-S protein